MVTVFLSAVLGIIRTASAIRILQVVMGKTPSMVQTIHQDGTEVRQTQGRIVLAQALH